MAHLLELLTARGLVQDATPGLAERLAQGQPLSGYVGFDPTAPSLHVGNLVPIMGLAWLQRLGGTPVVLVGGGTGMVGDPSGKRAERPMLTQEAIDGNAATLQTQLTRFLDFTGPHAARLFNNAEWLRQIGLMEFLRETGKHFTVGYMLQKESVRSRLESGISFTEFSYMLTQAYDYWHLYRTARCELQMGGSDQWGNITAGIELIHRREQATVHGLVFPLLTTTAGAKFGKSEGGNVWLDPDATSPYHFYQFWLNSDDRDVERYLKCFTFRPLDEIAEVMQRHAAEPSRREAQRALAWEVTERVHGPAEAQRAKDTSESLFRSVTGSDQASAAEKVAVLLETQGDIPQLVRSRADFADGGMLLVDALVETKLASSKADARRGIQGRGYYVNDEQQDDPARRLTLADVVAGDTILLRKGKKNYARLVLT